MDYFLTLSGSDICPVLHKKACPKLQQAKSTVYVGYYWGEHAAIQQAVVVARGTVVLCPLCINQHNEEAQ